MQRQSQLRNLFVEGLGPETTARMIYAPLNPFEKGLLNLGETRDGSLDGGTTADADRTIVGLHPDTIFAWEQYDPLSSLAASPAAKAGKPGVSYYQVLGPLLRAFDEHEWVDESGNVTDNSTEADEGKRRQANLRGYLYGELISLISKHWSSRGTDTTQSKSPNGAVYAFQSNGVSYEPLIAEALIDAQLMARIRDVMVAIDDIEVDDGAGGKIDGITVLAQVTATLFDPAKSCGPAGCDKSPLAYRDGRTSTATNTGKQVAAVAPIYLLTDALNAIDRRFEGKNQERLGPWRRARSQLIDVWLEVRREQDGWKFKNQHTSAVMRAALALLRGRLEAYGKEERACLDAGGSATTCTQTRDWAFGLADRFAASLSQPVIAAALRLLDQFRGMPSDPAGEMFKLVHFISQQRANGSATENKAVDTTQLAMTDLLQVFDDSKNTAPVMRFLAQAMAPNAFEVVSGRQAELDLSHSIVEENLALIRELKKLDDAPSGQPSTFSRIFRALATPFGKHGETPLDVIVDAIAEVNRAAPVSDDGKPFDAADLRAMLKETADYLSSERHGLERMYDVIQSRKLP